MKISIVILTVIVGAALARPEPPILGKFIPILESTDVRDGSGQYALSYKTGNGIAAVEQGALKPNADKTDNVLVKQGSYSFAAPNGQVFTTTYVADERGFLVSGDHLPKQVLPIVV